MDGDRHQTDRYILSIDPHRVVGEITIMIFQPNFLGEVPS